MNKYFLNYLLVLLSFTASCNQVSIKKSVTLDSQKYYETILNPTKDPKSITGWKIPKNNKEAFEELNSMLSNDLKDSLKFAAKAIDHYSKSDNCNYSYRINFANNFEIEDSAIVNNQLFYSDFLNAMAEIWDFEKSSKMMEYYHVKTSTNLTQLIIETYSSQLIGQDSKLSEILISNRKLRQKKVPDPCEIK